MPLESSVGLVVPAPTYESWVQTQRQLHEVMRLRITSCSLFHYHFSLNGERKHYEETGMT